MNNAVEGFIYVLKTQRNMRVHFLLAVFVLILALYLNMGRVDVLFLIAAISLVLLCEMINTSIELTIDLIKDAFHPLARIVKDIAAGAVLLSALNALAIGYMVFSKNIVLVMNEGITTVKQSPWHITLIALILVLFFVVAGKVFSKKGTPFRGGMPSGHAAFAFFIWTVITFLTKSGFISGLVFIMALLIARQRVNSGVHSLWEVVCGALLGFLTTALVFQIFG